MTVISNAPVMVIDVRAGHRCWSMSCARGGTVT
jgi:hypothetical protein